MSLKLNLSSYICIYIFLNLLFIAYIFIKVLFLSQIYTWIYYLNTFNYHSWKLNKRVFTIKSLKLIVKKSL